MKNIIIENAVCSNAGDMAIVIAIKRILENVFDEPLNITIYDSNPDACRELYPDYSFERLLGPLVFRPRLGTSRIKRWSTRAKNLKNRLAIKCLQLNLAPISKLLIDNQLINGIKNYLVADMVITTGGTYLREQYDLTDRIAQFRFDRACGKKTVFFTQTLGPFENQYNVNGLIDSFRSSPLILLRDLRSKENLSALIEADNCHVVADCVYALADHDKLTKIANRSLQKSDIKKIAISVRDWKYFNNKSYEVGMHNYKNASAKLSDWIVATHNFEVHFFSTCQGIPSYNYDDSAVAQDIYGMLDKKVQPRVTVNTEFHEPGEIMDFARSMDFVIATRMHMAIMALCVGTPVLPIANEFKQHELAKNLGLQDIICDINDITPESIIKSTSIYLGDFASFHSRSAASVLKEYESAMRAVPLLKAIA